MLTLSRKTAFRSKYLRRALHISYFLCNEEKSDLTASLRRTKHKKSFLELPVSFISPDGTRATPLEEWQSDSVHATTRSRASSFDESAPLINPKKKENHTVKKRGRKAKIEVEANIESTVILPDTEPNLLLPRKRKITKDGTTTEDRNSKTSQKRTAQEESQPPQPRTVLAKEILNNLEKFPHCLLLTRVGQFYESYFDQAYDIARLLNIKLTSRKWGGRRIAMCGFPLIHLDKHLKVLVQYHKRFVAMCEEFPRYSNMGIKEFDRKVVRIITPGTLIDEPFLNPYENNYLLAISSSSTNGDSLGLAWMDVSTGEFFSNVCALEGLQDELARISPREVVLDQKLQNVSGHPVSLALAEEGNFVSYIKPPETDFTIPPSQGSITISDESVRDDILTSPPSTIDSLSVHETQAVDLLTTFLHANLLDYMPSLSSPNREELQNRMQIDSHTIRALEIREGLYEGGAQGSLLSVIKRTTTTGGTRLLSRTLCSPSTSIPEIHRRQSLVAFFTLRPHFRADIMEALRNADDTGRIVQKLILGRGSCSDLLSLNKTIEVWTSIQDSAKEEKSMEIKERGQFNEEEWQSLEALLARMGDLRNLSSEIKRALEYDCEQEQEIQENDDLERDENADTDPVDRPAEPAAAVWRYNHDKWIFKPTFSDKILSLHTTLQKYLLQREQMEQSLQLKYDAPSLTLRSSPSQGMHVHLAKAKRDQTKINNDSSFVLTYESGTTKCYFHKEWSQLGSLITETTTGLIAAEKEAFEILRNKVTTQCMILRRNAQVLDELDVALAFASLATDMNFVKPTLSDDVSYNIVNGRHPAVELGLLVTGRIFTPNSVDMTPSSNLQIITGPNMAGKSTFLRQIALIAILAQSGSFVPADSATIGIVDKLFSRIGAKDDLFRDRSTFMVEMLETAEILRRATSRSLVIMDEVGRGTTVKDGLSIAFATVHHLVTVNKCRGLFATHFHELSDMLGYDHQSSGQGMFETVRFYCTDVDETEDDHFAYSYRLRPGVNRDSQGLKVAQLAGMPSSAIDIARQTLSWLNHQDTGLKFSTFNPQPNFS